MFRFTIRDVLTLTLAVAIGVAWLADRLNLATALVESEQQRIVQGYIIGDLEGEMEDISGQLRKCGLRLDRTSTNWTIVRPHSGTP